MVSSALTDRSYRPGTDALDLAPMAAALHRAFTDVEPPEAVPHCPHCVTPDQIEALRGPVAQLDPALVSRFVRKAGTTWGTPDELRRVTPRVLTLAADHRLLVSRATVWHQLRWARWTTWPAAQTDAVGRFLLNEFGRLLRNPARPAFVAHRWLADVSAGIDDLSGFFTVWHDTIGPLPDPAVQRTAVGHLVELLTTSKLRPDLPETMADVFPANPAAAVQMTEFLVGPGVDHHLRRATAEASGTPMARRLGVAVERLRRFRAGVERGGAEPSPLSD